MSAESKYDLIVVGAGQGGDPLAKAFAAAGKTVALVERNYVGGCCINYGCTPTKTMVAHAAAAYAVQDASRYGVSATLQGIDFAVVRKHKDDIVESFRASTEKHILSTKGIELIYGSARFESPKTIAVDLRGGGQRILSSDLIVLNTGASPSIPKIADLDQIQYYDSTSIQNVPTVPEHLVILGGGTIALEFGQMFRRFGSNVTILEGSSRLISREDPDVSDEIEKIFREDGIRVLKGLKVTGVGNSPAGFTLTLSSYDGPSEVRGSHLLIAIGRKPVTSGLGLELAGIELAEHGEIKVNDKLETTAPGVYAIGDVKGGPQFTHISYDDFRILKSNLLEGGSRTVSDRQVPSTTFTDPQISRIGLSETEAKNQGLDYKVAKISIADTSRGIESGNTRGFIKAVIDNKTKLILGATIICFESGELLPIFQMAMLGKLPYTVLRDAVFAHPVQAESINNLFLSLDS